MNHEFFMKAALDEARQAFEQGEVPIGAVVVHDNVIIGRGHNLRETKQSVMAHAEILAIEAACQHLNSWRLEACTLYITLEPCPMCAGAIIQARIPKVIYGAKDFKHGAHTSQINVFAADFNHQVDVRSGLLAEESAALLKDFFIALRNQRNSV